MIRREVRVRSLEVIECKTSMAVRFYLVDQPTSVIEYISPDDELVLIDLSSGRCLSVRHIVTMNIGVGEGMQYIEIAAGRIDPTVVMWP